MKKVILLFAIFSTLINTNSLNAQISGSIMHDGISRDYRLFLPSNYQDYVSLPLVFNLHGFGSNALEQDIYSGMNNVADTDHLIEIGPEQFFGIGLAGCGGGLENGGLDGQCLDGSD